jgi:hypothetical protein
MKLSIFLISILFSNLSFSIDYAACSKMLNDGLYKTYKYGGIDQPLTKATKDHGFSSASSVTSTEGTTAILDPKYWSNITTSETQSTSSTGECSAIALNNLKSERELYIAQNRNELFLDIAMGEGKFTEVLAYMSLCDKQATPDFQKAIQGKIESFVDRKIDLGSLIDQAVIDSKLLGKCHSYTI